MPGSFEYSLCMTHLDTHHGINYSNTHSHSHEFCHHADQDESHDHLTLKGCNHHQHEHCNPLKLQRAKFTKALKNCEPNYRYLFDSERPTENIKIIGKNLSIFKVFAPPDQSAEITDTIQLII
jgi:hypothetical protein